MIRAVLFDVGGTLHEVRHDPELADKFSQQLLDRLSKNGISLPIDAVSLTPLLHTNAEAYKHWSEEFRVELPGPRIWNEFYLKDFQIGEDALAPIAEELSWMFDAIRSKHVPRSHMRETVETLHEMGLVQGVISNMISTTFVPRVLADYGVAQYMSCVVVSASVGIRKPDPAIFELAAAQCGVPCSEMAYVGDTLSRDVLGCRNAKVALSIQISNPSIAHRDTAFTGTGLAPDVTITDLSEIPGIIRSYNNA